MKFYFTSKGIRCPDALLSLVGKTKNLNAGVILNANDLKPIENQISKLNAVVAEFYSFSIKVNFIDLRDYSASDKKLRELLLQNDMLWIGGGSVFYLRALMRKSGFDTIIREVVSSGVVYCGESAGAIIAGPSLTGFEVRESLDRIDEVIFDGLHLIDFTIMPHSGVEKFKPAFDNVKSICAAESRRFESISNTQVLVLRDGILSFFE